MPAPKPMSIRVPDNHVRDLVAKLSAMTVVPPAMPLKQTFREGNSLNVSPLKTTTSPPKLSHALNETVEVDDLLDLTVIDKEDYEEPYNAPLPPLPPPESPPAATKNSTNNQVSQQELMFAAVTPSTKRMCKMTEHFFLDYYFDMLTYLHQRKLRLEAFKNQARLSNWSQERYIIEWENYRKRESALLRTRRKRTQSNHFDILAQIGQGGYGKVYLAKKADTGEVCALKKMEKRLLESLNESQHILTERDILTQTQSEWLVKLLYAFQDSHFVYLAMEYVPGGDMRTLLNNSGILREKNAQFYTAEMFMAVNELHRLGYIHRDLKPENFLIDKTGHLKLTDFGLSKGQLSQARLDKMYEKLQNLRHEQLHHYSSLERRSMYRTLRREEMSRGFSLVGSPDYMAPEILMQSNHQGRKHAIVDGYDHLVDYWSLGCILYEMLCGFPPFAAPSMEEVWVNLYHWQEVLERPVYEGEDAEFNLSDEAWDLIKRLISHRHQRLASVAQLKVQPWFNQFNERLGQFEWCQLRQVPQNIMKPPFVPQLTSDEDRRHFDNFEELDDKTKAMYEQVYEKQERVEQDLKNDASKPLPRTRFLGFSFKHKARSNDWNEVETAMRSLTSHDTKQISPNRLSRFHNHLNRHFRKE